MKFRKKPVAIEAMQLALTNWREVLEFIGPDKGHYNRETGNLTIYTLEGRMLASPGDWIIKGVKGEFYPCKPDIFESTYEPTEKGGGIQQPGRAWYTRASAP